MPQSRTIRFDGWVLNVELSELIKAGRKIRLQDQPLQVLDELLAHPGELVTRERLIARLWPKGVVDFDTGLNSAVRKLRAALQDDAEAPLYIETVPRKGYRFIGTVDPPEADELHPPAPAAVVQPKLGPTATTGSAPTAPPTPTPSLTEPRNPFLRVAYVAAAISLISAAGLLLYRHESVPTATPQVSATTSPAKARLDGRTLAVLPLRPMSPEKDNELVALGVTDLIRERLAKLKSLTVISGNSTAGLTNAQPPALRDIADKLHARYLVQGGVTREGDRVRLEIQLVDAHAGSTIWSNTFDQATRELAAILDALVGHVASKLQVAMVPTTSGDSLAGPINLDAYVLYARGRRLLGTQRVSDTDEAVLLLQRVTTLDPMFAQGYLALGQAVLLAAQLRQAESDAVDAEALEAFNRALELDPQLGEAWIERARFTSDPSKANELFHKAIDLAPNYAMGYVRFSQFLSDHYRRGEAIDMIDRALRIDPLSPQLKFRAHVLLMLARTDFVGAEQQLREALAINPNFHPALENLGEIRCGFAGECADGLRLLERSIALDADSDSSKAAAATAYLEVDDPNAALAVVHDARQRTAALVQIAQYQHDGKRAAELARGASDNEWLTGKEELAEAVRDGAIATGDFRSALSILESQYERSGALSREFVASDAFLGLMYAHTLTFAGEIARGRKLAASLLVKLDTEAVGRTPYALSRPRAAAYAILGDDERALDMLENCLKMPYLTRWWYLSELDPLYQHLHQNPRFQAFAERARQHRLAQRKLVDEMRRKGELPNRILGEPVMGEPGTAAKQTK